MFSNPGILIYVLTRTATGTLFKATVRDLVDLPYVETTDHG